MSSAAKHQLQFDSQYCYLYTLQDDGFWQYMKMFNTREDAIKWIKNKGPLYLSPQFLDENGDLIES